MWREADCACARILATTALTQSGCPWLMFRRNTSAPDAISSPSFSSESDAGPRVQMIFVLRMRLQ